MLKHPEKLIPEEYSIICSKSEINEEDWRSFVFNHPHRNIFFLPEMAELFSDENSHESVCICVLDSKGRICGLLMAFIYREFMDLGGLPTARAIVNGGPLLKDDQLNVAGLLLDGFDKICRKKVIYSQFRNLWDNSFFTKIYVENGFIYEDHLNFLFDLSKGES